MPRVRGRSNASLSLTLDSRSMSTTLDDPLTRALQPPPDETPAEREERVRAEREAKRVSDEIDEELRRERIALKKKRPVRVLLLGQSESGKSTTLKSE
jgi:polynucleotide 5'-kinase involved in rRNA processing